MKPKPDSPLYALAHLYQAYYHKPWKTDQQFSAMERAAAVLFHHNAAVLLKREFDQWDKRGKKEGEHSKEKASPSRPKAR